ncbi:hypothetical protein X798_06051 [Onchocerca flexuosa]|uniref:Uncharacterized protein n=1 Tax=Onchocerca flexuosa TaxID=387005 RepID=A0A238BPR1_9BILA|nr:hypothetical protein X798_06051 [Onchocerca flexuosa]
MGTRLIRTKELLDAAIVHTAIQRVLVIRHVSPDEGIPPPRVHLTGRRPYYLYKIAMKQERDSWWSGFFPKSSISCKPEEIPTESISLLLPIRNASSAPMLLSISLERFQAESNYVQEALHMNELSLIISTTNIFHQIICTLAALKAGAIPLIYEGDIKHPDPSRISQIIYTYKVTKLLIAEEDLNVLLEYKQYITFWDLKTLKEILVLGSNKLCKQVDEIFCVPCRNIKSESI